MPSAPRTPSDPPGTSRWQVAWEPSRDDRRSHPELPAEASIHVWLQEIPLANGERLWLISTLPLGTEAIRQLYWCRQHVETDIRDVKVTLNTELIPGHSESMFEKELLTSLVAYNLVVQVRRLAARIADVPPRRLSFSGVLTAVKRADGRESGAVSSERMEPHRLCCPIRSNATNREPTQAPVPSRPQLSPKSAHARTTIPEQQAQIQLDQLK